MGKLPRKAVTTMARAGLEIGTQALWDQSNALAAHLEPTHDALHDHVLEAFLAG